MSTHRPAHTRILLALAATALAVTSVAGCSGGDDDSEATTTTAAEETTTTASTAEASTTTAAGASTDIETTDLLDHLNTEDPDVGGLFDWNTGAGVIAITYVGTQTVQLYASEIDEDTAMAACELAAPFVFGIDEEAAIEVLVGTYPDGEVLVTAAGPDGTCAPA